MFFPKKNNFTCNKLFYLAKKKRNPDEIGIKTHNSCTSELEIELRKLSKGKNYPDMNPSMNTKKSYLSTNYKS